MIETGNRGGEEICVRRQLDALSVGARRGADHRRRGLASGHAGRGDSGPAQVSGHRQRFRIVQSGGTPARRCGSFVRLRSSVGGLRQGAATTLLRRRLRNGRSRKARSWTGPTSTASESSMSSIAGACFITPGRCGWPSKMPLAGSRHGRQLFIAIYNDQGWKSHLWWFIKRLYNRLPRLLRAPFAFTVSAITRIAAIIKYTLKLKPMVAIAPLFADGRDRGMSARYDELDWIGGFPFEFASYESSPPTSPPAALRSSIPSATRAGVAMRLPCNEAHVRNSGISQGRRISHGRCTDHHRRADPDLVSSGSG